MKQSTLAPVKKKKINAKGKGDRNQIKSRDFLIKNGAYSYFNPPKTRYSKDFYGLFDYMIFLPSGHLAFVQSATNGWHYDKLEEIKHFTKNKKIVALITNALDGGVIKVRAFMDGEEVMKHFNEVQQSLSSSANIVT